MLSTLCSHHYFFENSDVQVCLSWRLRTVGHERLSKKKKDEHVYVLFLRNVLKYYLFFLWRLTDRLIQFVNWGVKGLKKYFTFLRWKMSRFAERRGQEEGEMTCSHSGSLTPRLSAAIGLSLAINMGTAIYSKFEVPTHIKDSRRYVCP